MNRPSLSEIFMASAFLWSLRSTCLRRKVGCVAVRDGRIIAAGYNGAPAGQPHCDQLGGCLREQMSVPSGERHELCRAVHAEQNAIVQAALFGTSLRGAEIYCTTFPCSICSKMLLNCGIESIYYCEWYKDPVAYALWQESGIIPVKVAKPRMAEYFGES